MQSGAGDKKTSENDIIVNEAREPHVKRKLPEAIRPPHEIKKHKNAHNNFFPEFDEDLVLLSPLGIADAEEGHTVQKPEGVDDEAAQYLLDLDFNINNSKAF
jgi:hypothetical protein